MDFPPEIQNSRKLEGCAGRGSIAMSSRTGRTTSSRQQSVLERIPIYSHDLVWQSSKNQLITIWYVSVTDSKSASFCCWRVLIIFLNIEYHNHDCVIIVGSTEIWSRYSIIRAILSLSSSLIGFLLLDVLKVLRPAGSILEKKVLLFFHLRMWVCDSNFFVFQSYELRFSGKFCLFLKRSFPVSFVVGSIPGGTTGGIPGTRFWPKLKVVSEPAGRTTFKGIRSGEFSPRAHNVFEDQPTNFQTRALLVSDNLQKVHVRVVAGIMIVVRHSKVGVSTILCSYFSQLVSSFHCCVRSFIISSPYLFTGRCPHISIGDFHDSNFHNQSSSLRGVAPAFQFQLSKRIKYRIWFSPRRVRIWFGRHSPHFPADCVVSWFLALMASRGRTV